MNVIGMDPGFASFGICVVNLQQEREVIGEIKVIRTAKSAKKLNVKSTDDNFRRACDLARAIRQLVEEVHPSAFVAEAASFPRNASAAAKVAMAWGVLADICVARKIPMIQATPQEIKKALCGRPTANKLEVQIALEKRYFCDLEINQFKRDYAGGQWEHGFDALGAVVACLDDPVLQMARRVRI